MRSRRFVALFGGRTADRPGELRDGGRGSGTRGQEGTVVAIVEAADGGTSEERHGTYLRAQLGGKQ